MKTITDEIVANFEHYLYEEEKSGNTIEKYMRDIRFFRQWIGNKAPEKTDVVQYKKELCKRYAPKSVNSILSSLNALFVFMERYDLKVKMLKIQRQIFASKEKELTKSEYERLLRAAKRNGNRKLYLLMQTICATGIRVSELQCITVTAIQYGQANIDCKGKTRTVIIPDALCRVLREYAKEQKITSGNIFVSKNGRPLDRSNIWRLMKSLCEEAGVSKEKVFPHNLRHLFARTYYSQEKDIARLADILGHTSIDTTRIYTRESGEIHRKQIQRLGLLRC